MTRSRTILSDLSRAAKALGPLLNNVVFVGGATVPCYIDDPAAPDVRPTDDVDIVVSTLSRGAYHQFEDALRKAGFRNDQSEGAPICRWKYGAGLVFDVMPTDTSVLGFSNPWYQRGFEDAIAFKLPDNTSIRIFTLIHFILSKWEAFLDRGADDPTISHDLEDLVAVLDGRRDVERQLKDAEGTERNALGAMCRAITASPTLMEAVEGHLGSGESGRYPKLETMLHALAHV